MREKIAALALVGLIALVTAPGALAQSDESVQSGDGLVGQIQEAPQAAFERPAGTGHSAVPSFDDFASDQVATVSWEDTRLIDDVDSYAYILAPSRWQVSEIPVCFVNPGAADARKRDVVRRAANQWAKVANINFVGFGSCNGRAPGIQIRWEDVAGSPPRSIVGRYSVGDLPSMHLNPTFETFPCPYSVERCIFIVAVHEFGHAIGLLHEHDRPDTPGSCRTPRPVPGAEAVGRWDINSTMNYCNPKWSNLGRLSAGDITAARVMYPHSCDGRRATLVSGFGPSHIVGTAGADVILGYDGADRIEGRGGDDRICGGAGRDTLIGDVGNDVLIGGGHGDTLHGGPGADLIRGGDGNDALTGGYGADRLQGQFGDDNLNGGPGSDVVWGGVGNDVVSGGAGANDRCFGEAGRDRHGFGCEQRSGIES